MVQVFYGGKFLKSARKLPKPQQEKLAKLLTLIENNPFDPKLHTKSLKAELSGLYSFRVTRDWRVIFQFISPSQIQLIEVGNRKEIYQ